jgi:hypothetical protein
MVTSGRGGGGTDAADRWLWVDHCPMAFILGLDELTYKNKSARNGRER